MLQLARAPPASLHLPLAKHLSRPTHTHFFLALPPFIGAFPFGCGTLPFDTLPPERPDALPFLPKDPPLEYPAISHSLPFANASTSLNTPSNRDSSGPFGVSILVPTGPSVRSMMY